MNLVASVIVRNEADRYLRPFLEHLLDFCDAVRVLDDGSDDSFRDLAWFDDDRVQILRNNKPEFMEHEGKARQALLDWTFQADPTHVLAIDADEFVDKGSRLRELCGERTRSGLGVWNLTMKEVWTATTGSLRIREDGLWGARPCPILYEVPARRNAYRWRIANRAAAPGREPQAVVAVRNRARPSGVDILHFGWANVADRPVRYARYAVDGFGHNPAHIESIMYGDDRVETSLYAWPEELLPWQEQIVARAQRNANLDLPPSPDPGGGQVVPEVMLGGGGGGGGVSSASTGQGLGGGGVRPPVDEYAFMRKHPDGRWVGIRWDGTIETS